MTASLSRTVITRLEGTWNSGVIRVECRPDRAGCGWRASHPSWTDAATAGNQHDCAAFWSGWVEWAVGAGFDIGAGFDEQSGDDEGLLPGRAEALSRPGWVRPRRFRHLASTLTAGIRGTT